MSFWRRATCILAILFCASALLQGQNSTGSKTNLLRYAPIPATNALRTFQLRPGFRLRLVAEEPLVVAPVAMAFDEDGRMFVAEMRDYPEAVTTAPIGTIRMLADTNSDGVFDTSTFYATNLPLPSAVICYGGGIFVAATPDILFFKDNDGDGVADTREVVFTGFGNAMPRFSVDGILNSFAWGLDNRIHGVTGGNGGNITSVKSRQPGPIPLRSKDFSFDPRMFTLDAESGTAQLGMSFDSRSRKFVCDDTHHAKLVMYEARYASRNPFYAMPAPLVDIAPAAAPIFRLSPAPNTRYESPPFAANISRARGITIYRGNAFPAEFQETAFVCDAAANLIHHDKLRESGLELRAERAGDPRMEFLASRDTWFRPVALANAPDGTLYVADMYRESLANGIDAAQAPPNPANGNERGRVYRIAPANFKQPPIPKLSKVATTNLVGLLASPNGWTRDAAARLIYERQDKAAVRLLTRLAAESPSPLGRLHALCALDGLQALTEAHLIRALGDRDERVREKAVQLSEKLVSLNGTLSESLWTQLAGLRADASPRVRFQLALTVGELQQRGKIPLLVDVLRRDLENPWMRAAILSSLNGIAGEMFAAASKDNRFRGSSAGREFLYEVASMIGTKNDTNEVLQTMEVLFREPDLEIALNGCSSLGEGLGRAKTSLLNYDPRNNLWTLFDAAVVTIDNYGGTNSLRMAAIRFLVQRTFGEVGYVYFNLLDVKEPDEVKIAALRALAQFTPPEATAGIMQRWRSLSPRGRSEALGILMSRRDGIAALLAGVRSRIIAPAELAYDQIRILTNSRDAQLRDQAVQIFGEVVAPDRRSVVAQFQGALKLAGRAGNGREIFRARCISCHQLNGEGHAAGPDLASVRRAGKEQLLASILDPNRKVAPNYVSYNVETKDGETVLGIIVNETPSSLLLRQANGVERVVFSSKIAKIETAGLSLMPEGLENGLNAQQMADLLEFLSR